MKQISRKSSLASVVLSALLVSTTLSQTSLPAPKQEKLLNGLRVMMWPDPKAIKVFVKLRIHSGAAFDPQGKEGLMHMLSENFFPNKASRDFFDEDLDGLLLVFAKHDYLQIDASSTPDKFPTMLDTIASAVMNPTIDKETTASLREAQIAEIAKYDADAEQVADEAFDKRMFGTFPYARSSFGTAQSLNAISPSDLLQAKQRFVTADNATLAIYGDFDRASAMRAVRRYFGGWIKADKSVPATFRQPDDPQSAVLVLPWPKPGVFQARIGIRGPARSDNDVAPALVFAYVLQDRMRKLTGQADAKINVGSHMLAGTFAIAISHPIDMTAAAGFFAKSLSDPITDAEFNASKAAMVTYWSQRDDYSLWLDTDTYKLPISDAAVQGLDAVTLKQVSAYAENARKQPIVTVLVRSTPTKQ